MPAFSFPTLSFEAFNQSTFGTDGPGAIEGTEKVETSFDERVIVKTPNVLGNKAEFGLDFDGDLDFTFDYNLDPGTFDASLAFDASIVAPDFFVAGEPIVLTGISNLVAGVFEASSPTVEAAVDVAYSVFLEAFGLVDTTFGDPNRFSEVLVDGSDAGEVVSFDLQDGVTFLAGFSDDPPNVDLTSLTADLKVTFPPGAQVTFTVGDGTPKTIGSAGPFATSVGDLELNLPVVKTSGTAQNGIIEARASDDVVDLDLDIDALLPFFPGGFSLSAGPASFTLDLLDVDGGPDVDLFQDFTLVPELYVRLDFDQEVLVNGNARTFFASEFDELEELDLTVFEETVVTPTFLVGALLRNETGFEIDQVITVEGLGASASVKAGPFTLKQSFDPLFEDEFRIDPLAAEIAVFSDFFDVTDAFGSVVGDSFTLTPGSATGSTSVIAFGELRLAPGGSAINAPAPDALNEIDPSWLTGKGGIQFRQLVAFVDEDGDPETGEGAFRGYDTAFNLSDKGYGDRARSLKRDNDAANDPVVITASGFISRNQIGDLTHGVRYSDEEGFGLDNGPDGALSRWLNFGDALDFAVSEGNLQEVRFIANVRDANNNGLADEDAVIALDVDGDAFISFNGQIFNEFLLRIEGVNDGDEIVINFEDRTIEGGTVFGTTASFFDAFEEAGSDNITIAGIGGGNRAFAIKDLELTTSTEFVPPPPVEGPDIDALIAKEGGNGVLLNDGDGSFSLAGSPGAGQNSFAAALGDVDGDGDLDAVAAGFALGALVLDNDGSGSFTATDIPEGNSNSLGVALGDMDGDGDLDAVLANIGVDQLLTNDGNGNFAASTLPSGGVNSADVAVGDLNGDGALDVVFATLSGPNQLLLTDEGGSLNAENLPGGNTSSLGVALGDADGDGALDIFFANSEGPNQLLLNDGNGVFSSAELPGGARSSADLAVGDVNGDGSLDVVVVNGASQANQLLLNDGDGSFSVTELPGGDRNGLGVALGDLDGDDDLDIIVANGRPASDQLLLNDGAGGFTASDLAGGNASSFDVALGDLDGDGTVPILTASGLPELGPLLPDPAETVFV